MLSFNSPTHQTALQQADRIAYDFLKYKFKMYDAYELPIEFSDLRPRR